MEDLTEAENEQISQCILRLEYTPTNCQIYMQEMMYKFLPMLYKDVGRFKLKEVIRVKLDDGLWIINFESLMMRVHATCAMYYRNVILHK